jgi:hypothetical protein
MRDETDAWNHGALMRFHESPIYTVEEIEAILDGVIIDGNTAQATAQKKEALERLERTLDRSNATESQKKALLEKVKPLLDRILRMESPQEALDDLERYLYEKVLRRRSEATEPRQPSPGNATVGIVTQDEQTRNATLGIVTQDEQTRNATVGIVTQDEQTRNATLGIVVQNEHPDTTGMAEGDAFKRNWRDLLPFARRFFKCHHRLPTTDEALTYLHDNGLYSGAWADSGNRARRVVSIVQKIAEGFDEGKLGTGEHQELNPCKFEWWVRHRFGSHMRAKVEKRKCFDAETMTYPKRMVDVPLRFVCGFLTAAEIAIAKSENGRISTNWFKDMFKQMGIAWNQDYYMATRDKLHAMGVIHVIDRHHKKNVAWRWGTCFNIPASWKGEQRALKDKIVKGDPEELPSFYHDITVYTIEDEETSSETPFRPPRPPPDDERYEETWTDEACFEMIGEEGLS